MYICICIYIYLGWGSVIIHYKRLQNYCVSVSWAQGSNRGYRQQCQGGCEPGAPWQCLTWARLWLQGWERGPWLPTACPHPAGSGCWGGPGDPPWTFQWTGCTGFDRSPVCGTVLPLLFLPQPCLAGDEWPTHLGLPCVAPPMLCHHWLSWSGDDGRGHLLHETPCGFDCFTDF